MLKGPLAAEPAGTAAMEAAYGSTPLDPGDERCRFNCTVQLPQELHCTDLRIHDSVQNIHIY